MKGQAVVWRFLDVQQFLRTIPIRHKEKTEKRDLVAELEYRGPGPENLELANRWNQLVARIRAQRADSIRQASEAVRYRPPTQIQPE